MQQAAVTHIHSDIFTVTLCKDEEMFLDCDHSSETETGANLRQPQEHASHYGAQLSLRRLH